MSLSKFTYKMAMKYKCGGAGENLERGFTLRNALLVSLQCIFFDVELSRESYHFPRENLPSKISKSPKCLKLQISKMKTVTPPHLRVLHHCRNESILPEMRKKVVGALQEGRIFGAWLMPSWQSWWIIGVISWWPHHGNRESFMLLVSCN